MRDALVGLLDKVDAAVAESRGVLDPSDLEAAAKLARDIRLRLAYPASIVVAALAGGTGSGKSSLLNVVAGEEVALTGGIRPTTLTPLALVPASGGQSLSGYLDALGVSERVDHDGPPWLCLLDLPDNDSVELDHRHQVDALLPRVDAVIWVIDPEKYRDASIHQGYIAPLAAYQRQFLFVLNQVDRLDEIDAPAVLADLEEALREDGIEDPGVIPTSANPVVGPPFGIEEVVQRLEQELGRRGAVHRKLLTDLAAAASRLVESSSGARGVEFERRWEREMAAAVSLAFGGRVADGGHRLATFVTGLAGEVEGEISGHLRELAVEVPSAFLGCAADADMRSALPGERSASWLGRLLRTQERDSSPTDESSARERLETSVNRAIGHPIRELLSRRGKAHAAISDLALAVGDLERRTV
jgi:hypothetical protein